MTDSTRLDLHYIPVMTYNPPSLESLQAQCDAFNFDCKPGSRVAVKLDGKDAPFITTTRSPAQVLSGHSAVVWLTGVSGCYDIGRVTPIPVEQATAGSREQCAVDALDGLGYTYNADMGWLPPAPLANMAIDTKAVDEDGLLAALESCDSARILMLHEGQEMPCTPTPPDERHALILGQAVAMLGGQWPGDKGDRFVFNGEFIEKGEFEALAKLAKQKATP